MIGDWWVQGIRPKVDEPRTGPDLISGRAEGGQARVGLSPTYVDSSTGVGKGLGKGVEDGEGLGRGGWVGELCDGPCSRCMLV